MPTPAKKMKSGTVVVSDGKQVMVKGGGIVRIFKIGDVHRPAKQEDIDDFAKKLQTCYDNPGTPLVCHHAVQTEVVGQEESQFLMMLHDKGIINGKELKKKIGL
jgi:hypothetical protein